MTRGFQVNKDISHEGTMDTKKSMKEAHFLDRLSENPNIVNCSKYIERASRWRIFETNSTIIRK